MSRRRKLEKFAAIRSFTNVYEMGELNSHELVANSFDKIDLRGKWREQVFGNDNPLILELACGRGEYTLGLAQRYPDHNFVGVDIKGARIYQGAKYALDNDISNIAFLRIRIEQIGQYFAKDELDGIWITFPDPFPSKANRRLTSPSFLDRYYYLLRDQGQLMLKTDSTDLFDYSLKTISSDPRYAVDTVDRDIYASESLCHPDLDIKTYYEKMHLANQKRIKFLQAHI